MFTKNRKAKGAVQLAMVGLFSFVATGAFAGEGCSSPTTAVAFMGQLEVTAPIHIADAGSMVVEAKRVREVAQLGSMTVTAPRMPTFAERDTKSESEGSSGETSARTRSPRAVLVQ
jgi:hypothetical protein